jgi:hypothetical protein
MTLRDDLTALLADAGIIDVDIDKAVEDEHVRSSAYQRVISVAAASQHRDGDRTLVATILRDPEEMTSKTAVVDLVDTIAAKTTNPAEFQQWSADILPEVDRLTTEGNRRFIHRRIHDWTFWLTVEAGHTPAPDELADVTDWMQRRIAEESTSVPVLTVLAEHGSTKKIRNIARNRAAKSDRTPPVR